MAMRCDRLVAGRFEIFPMASRAGSVSFPEVLTAIEAEVHAHPENTETVITELLYLMEKFDKASVQNTPLIRPGFEPDDVLARIKKHAQLPKLTVPNIRFFAASLSRSKHLPLPEATRKHKQALMQWFDVHWDAIVADIGQWKNEEAKADDDDD
jgi:hypothetical protein